MSTANPHPPNHTERSARAAGTRVDDNPRTPQKYEALPGGATWMVTITILRRESCCLLLTRPSHNVDMILS
jgi:hypothetical protein